MNKKWLAPGLAIVLALMACSVNIYTTNTPPAITTDTPAPGASNTNTVAPPSTDTTTPSNTDTPIYTPSFTATVTPPTPTFTPIPSSAPGLSLDALRNATVYGVYFGRTVKLVNGGYSEGSGATYYSIQLLDIYAYGDLNGDGKADSAVILAENSGGSGVFISVAAFLNQAGVPHQISQVELGDRVSVKSGNISLGVIHLNTIVHAPNDPLCCPSQPEVQSFWLLGNQLWLMAVTSGPTGVERSINITFPANWASVNNPFTVNGNVTISPFENTLNYGVYQLDGKTINSSSVMVTSAGMGTPGTFTKTFNLSSAGVTGLIVVQFKDISPADGSILAMHSTVLNLH